MAAISLTKVEETAPALVSLYRTAGEDSGSADPALVLFQTDGGPGNPFAAERSAVAVPAGGPDRDHHNGRRDDQEEAPGDRGAGAAP